MSDEKNPNFFAAYADDIKSQVEDRLLLYRLQAVKITSNLLSNILMFSLVALFGFFVLVFLSVMLAFYLSEVLDSYYWGFGCVAGLYILLLVICIVFKKSLFGKFIMGNIANIIFDKTEKKDPDDGK
ncbi:phage holin family protein [Haoranjiania flava]|uniref:Phage holin family protein n=1 Tax=Haoranjiania flava TaxID=1856322 RepID=A0AAE3INE8_9BACT|nr:phage holin family protein [Haoranjiania flava]MCU7693511.1 phage holin family protein [Haoranjiania flava]